MEKEEQGSSYRLCCSGEVGWRSRAIRSVVRCFQLWEGRAPGKIANDDTFHEPSNLVDRSEYTKSEEGYRRYVF